VQPGLAEPRRACRRAKPQLELRRGGGWCQIISVQFGRQQDSVPNPTSDGVCCQQMKRPSPARSSIRGRRHCTASIFFSGSPPCDICRGCPPKKTTCTLKKKMDVRPCIRADAHGPLLKTRYLGAAAHRVRGVDFLVYIASLQLIKEHMRLSII
jgi:hypothetical protein